MGEVDVYTVQSHTAAGKHLLRYLTRTAEFPITCKQKGFKLASALDANGGNKLDNSKSFYLYHTSKRA